MALKVGELNVLIKLNVQEINDQLRSVEKLVGDVGKAFGSLSTAGINAFDQIRANAGNAEAALKRLEQFSLTNINQGVAAATQTATKRVRAPSQATITRLQNAASAYTALESSASTATNAQITHLTRFENAARNSHGRIAQSAKDLADYRINESLRVLNSTKEHLAKINTEFKNASDYQKEQIKEVTLAYLESQRQIAGFFSRMNRTGGRRFTRTAAAPAPIVDQIDPNAQVQPARGVVNRLGITRDPFNALNRNLTGLTNELSLLRRSLGSGARLYAAGGRGGGGGGNRPGGMMNALFGQGPFTGGGHGLPRFGGVTGMVASVFGVIGLADLIRNLAMAVKDFAVQSVNMSNELSRTSLSARMVSGNFKDYAAVMEVARKNQRLFGGSLSENVQELTGFSLVARTARVDMETLVSVSQRLALFDPGQGIQGASIALREFLAGNIRSLRERFELPANVLKQLGDQSQSAQKRLENLSNFLDSQGLSAEALGERLSQTAQVYADFAISWERLTLRMGDYFAYTFKGVTQTFSDMIDRFTNDADQLARDFYKLRADVQLTDEQIAKGNELAAENSIKRIRALIDGSTEEFQQDVANAFRLGMGGSARVYEDFPTLEEQFPSLNEFTNQAFEVLKLAPELEGQIFSMFQAFRDAPGPEGLTKLRDEINQMYEDLVAGPARISEAMNFLRGAFFVFDGTLGQYKDVIDDITQAVPKYSENIAYLVRNLLSGNITHEQFAVGLENIRIAANLTGASVEEYADAVKNANLQFVENQIASYETAKAQRYLTQIMDNAAFATKLSGDQIELIAKLLNVEKDEVYKLVNAWRALNLERTFGAKDADKLEAIRSSTLPDFLKASMMESVARQHMRDYEFELTASTAQLLERATKNFETAKRLYSDPLDPRRIQAEKEMIELQVRLQREMENTADSAGSSASAQGDAYEDLREIIRDYHRDIVDAEKDFQQKILDIQKEFQEKQQRALDRSEVGKRRGRSSVYRDLMDAEISQAQKQEISAAYESEHALAMQYASEGKIELSQDLLDFAKEVVALDIQYIEDVNQAMEDGDAARAEALGVLYRFDKEAMDYERRRLIEGGDPNVNQYNEDVKNAELEQAQRIDDINVKYQDRAQTLLEKEPQIIELIGGTNEELSKQAEVLQKMASYSSPVELGLDGIASSADDALKAVKELIDYMRTNNIGSIFTGGVVGGITDGTPAVVDAAEGMVDSTVDAAKGELEARSPSRRTMREIGVPFVQGIAKGISKTSNALNRVVTGVMNGAVKVANMELPTGIRKSQENIDAFKNFAQTNISILEGLRGLLPKGGGAAQGRASYVAAIAKIDQDTEAQITARREKLSRDLLLARTEDERRIIQAIADQDISLLQQQANIQKASQGEELRNVADQEAIDAKMSAIQQNAANQLKKLQERMKELAKTNPEEAARRYQIRAQQILDRANLQQELERYLLENNLTADDAYASLLRQQIQQLNALANMEVFGTGVGNAPINNTVYNINMDLTGSNLRKEDVRTIVKQELAKALSSSKGSTA